MDQGTPASGSDWEPGTGSIISPDRQHHPSRVMKLTLITVAACVVLLATLAESTPTPGPGLLNLTAPTASASMVDRIMAFQDHVRQWANQLSEKTRSAFQKLQVQEVNRVMSTWFSDIGKKFAGFGKKAQ